MSDRKLLTAHELAARLAVRPSTIRKWARQGRIPEVFLTRKVRRFDFGAVVAALKQVQTTDTRQGVADEA
jgi:excisionase family DNA binding protein